MSTESEAASIAAAAGHQLGGDRTSAPHHDKPKIEVSAGMPETIRSLVQAINHRKLPQTYVSDGRVMHLEEVSGSATVVAGDEDSPLPVTATEVKAPDLARLLASGTRTYRMKARKDGDSEPEETTPPVQALTAALSGKTWPGLQTFRGIVGAPVLRPDGTLLQTPGYDQQTGLYLASKIPLDHVPEKPTAAQVEAARAFLLDEFLHDFPWADEASLPNYIGILATPILMRYLRALTPFAVYTATMPGSGKTILTSGPGMLYGQRVLTWTHNDEELRKSITSVLADPVGTVIFDNLAEGSVIDSPVLARLLTDRTWADRLLGGNTTASYANDRLWSATGNNLQLGGDMATRTVLVGLDPDAPRPEERTGFQIPDLDQWILVPANQRRILWNLLVLVIDWTQNGAPRQDGITMRQFTTWAAALGGFLGHHGIKGFLTNIETVRGIDEQDATWTAFLAKWRQIHGDTPLTAKKLLDGADPEQFGYQWDGLFLTDARGKLPSSKSLGRMLMAHRRTWHGGQFRLQSEVNSHSRIHEWWVVERSPDDACSGGPEVTQQTQQTQQHAF